MSRSVTRTLDSGASARLFRRKYRLQVTQGPDQGKALTSLEPRATIGAAAQNDLVLSDPAVSRHHLRIELVPAGFLLTDLGSTNGTRIGDLQIDRVTAPGPVTLSLGGDTLRLTALEEEQEVPLLASDRFGSLLGQGPAARELFLCLEAAAKRNVTVLIEGETGTGKELIARELHLHSPRAQKPFVVVDCSAVPPSLIESELYGHVAGAFTGAVGGRAGAFEEADGGTIFLDEVGELESALQPRLLRVLEQMEIKRLGSNERKKLDVRVVAATNRDLMRCVNEGTFRSDLFYRLAVVQIRVPPLRERLEDIELLFRHFLHAAAEAWQIPEPAVNATTMQQVIAHRWPGNVRELRNFVERWLTLSGSAPELSTSAAAPLLAPLLPSVESLESLPFREAKAEWTEAFERHYLSRLLARVGYNVAEAARQSGIDRVHLFRLIKRYQLK